MSLGTIALDAEAVMHAEHTAADHAQQVLVACPQCHTLVRVAGERLADRPRCARCKAQVLSGQPIELDAAAFATHVERATLPVLVDFWAPWCGPCRMMAPVLDEAAHRWAERLQLGKVNTDVEQQLASRFNIRSIPTLILFDGGREIARQSGAVDLASLTRWLESSLAARAPR
jgi:thioredoxin 2